MVIQVLWDRQAESIIDVKLGNADADSYNYEPMTALLDWRETRKKNKHGKDCHNQKKCFSPFVLSVNGMLGKESLVLLLQLSQIMAEKMD